MLGASPRPPRPRTMRLQHLGAAALLLLPLAACHSGGPQTTDHAVEDAAEARLPEVRFYMIADT